MADLLGAISIFVIIESWHRLWEPAEVRGTLMMTVAAGGMLVNVLGLWLLHSHRETNINVHGAWLHVMADLLGSFAASREVRDLVVRLVVGRSGGVGADLAVDHLFVVGDVEGCHRDPHGRDARPRRSG